MAALHAPHVRIRNGPAPVQQTQPVGLERRVQVVAVRPVHIQQQRGPAVAGPPPALHDGDGHPHAVPAGEPLPEALVRRWVEWWMPRPLCAGLNIPQESPTGNVDTKTGVSPALGMAPHAVGSCMTHGLSPSETGDKTHARLPGCQKGDVSRSVPPTGAWNTFVRAAVVKSQSNSTSGATPDAAPIRTLLAWTS
jgi:hypothetical protein